MTSSSFEFVADSADKSAGPFLKSVVQVAFDGTPPRSVLDVGCGPGMWLAEWLRMGVREIAGVDGDYVPRSALAIPPDAFRAVDISQPFDLGRGFKLVVCLEVAEHVPEAHAERPDRQPLPTWRPHHVLGGDSGPRR